MSGATSESGVHPSEVLVAGGLGARVPLFPCEGAARLDDHSNPPLGTPWDSRGRIAGQVDCAEWRANEASGPASFPWVELEGRVLAGGGRALAPGRPAPSTSGDLRA